MRTSKSAQTVAVNERGLRIGEDHPRARLTNHDVDLMREMHGQGMGYRRLAKMFGCSRTCVAVICRYEKRVQYPVRWKALRVK